MRGPEIITRTLSSAAVSDKFGNTWQYHSRSDHHSKVACWAIAFDLLTTSKMLRDHITAGVVTFGINRRMIDFETGKRKVLDLVIARAPGTDPGGVASSAQALDLWMLADRYGIRLTRSDRAALDALALPPPPADAPGATVLVALEAKACMTAHIAALPRLHDELTSSHSIVHGDTPNALSVGFVMVNTSDTFISPGKVTWNLSDRPAPVNTHRQLHVTERTVDMLMEVRRRSGPGSPQHGFDALGIMLVEMANDGSPASFVTTPPAPLPGGAFSYESMIQRAGHLYDVTFSGLA